MRKSQPTVARYVQPHRYKSPNIPLSAIKRYARQIAEKFHPEKIILFGSYAYGTPHNESDVDLLVIMACRDAFAQALRIDRVVDAPFLLHLIVRTPYQIKHRLKDPTDRDWFLYEITEKGKILYEAPHRRVGIQSRGRLGIGKQPSRPSQTSHCQQAAEKYLKALLQELGAAVPRTHILRDLRDLLLPFDPTLKNLRRGLKGLTRHAVEYRYPGIRTTAREMQTALRTAGRVRAEMRARLGLSA